MSNRVNYFIVATVAIAMMVTILAIPPSATGQSGTASPTLALQGDHSFSDSSSIDVAVTLDATPLAVYWRTSRQENANAIDRVIAIAGHALTLNAARHDVDVAVTALGGTIISANYYLTVQFIIRISPSEINALYDIPGVVSVSQVPVSSGGPPAVGGDSPITE